MYSRPRRTILHADMDAFFAAVELLRHPELKGRPVIVGGHGDPAERGVVSTASYEARRFGIHSGMPLRTAWRRCPDAVFLPVDYRIYAKVSTAIRAVLQEFSPRVEPIGLDEAFMDVTGSTQPPEALARAIKERIKERTGLTCSVGIAPNKLLAKIASDLEKPNGLTRIEMEDIPQRVWPLPARTIWGIGPKSEARLARLGVTTIGELATLPLATLIRLFGQAHGRYLHDAARGIDESPVAARRQRRSVGHEVTFQRDVHDGEVLDRELGELAARVVARLHQYHYTARTVTVKLRFADFRTHSRSLTLTEPGDQLPILERAAHRCLERFSITRPVRLIGLRLSHLDAHAPAHRAS